MEGIVFVYIFRANSFAGHLNEYSQFACLQQLIRCFLFANVNRVFSAISATITRVGASTILDAKPNVNILISTWVITIKH